LRLRNILKDMKKRCYNNKSIRYARYGGRGISICDEWREETNAFYRWALGSGYQDDLTIDRINNEEGYSPVNCRWAGYSEQMQNSSKAKLSATDVLKIRALHPELSYSVIAEKYQVNKSTIASIVTRKTWSNV